MMLTQLCQMDYPIVGKPKWNQYQTHASYLVCLEGLKETFIHMKKE